MPGCRRRPFPCLHVSPLGLSVGRCRREGGGVSGPLPAGAWVRRGLSTPVDSSDRCRHVTHSPTRSLPRGRRLEVGDEPARRQVTSFGSGSIWACEPKDPLVSLLGGRLCKGFSTGAAEGAAEGSTNRSRCHRADKERTTDRQGRPEWSTGETGLVCVMGCGRTRHGASERRERGPGNVPPQRRPLREGGPGAFRRRVGVWKRRPTEEGPLRRRARREVGPRGGQWPRGTSRRPLGWADRTRKRREHLRGALEVLPTRRRCRMLSRPV